MRKLCKFSSFIVLLLSFCFVLSAQNNKDIDSLKLEFKKTKEDTSKIKILLDLSGQYSHSDSKKAFDCIAKAKNICSRHNYKEASADIFLQEGMVYNYSANYEAALEDFENALAIYLRLNKPVKTATAHLWIGILNSELTNIDKALGHYSTAMKLYKQAGDDEGMSKCYKLMATVYTSQGNYKTALKYLQNAIILSKDKHNIAKMYINVSLNYYMLGDYKKSVSYFDTIVPVLKEMNDLDGLAKVYGNFGTTYIDLRKYKKAKEYFSIAMKYTSELGNITNRLYIQTSLAELYTEMNQPDSAIILLTEAIELNKKLNIGQLYEYMYYDISEAYEKWGDTKSALEYFKKYKTVCDSAAKELSNQKLLEIQTQWEVDKKNDQIKLAKQKSMTYGIGLIALFVSGLALFIYLKRKAREKMLLYDAEIKEAAHKIDLKHRELTHKAIHNGQQEQLLSDIKEKLERINGENPGTKETINDLLSSINMHLKQNSLDDFEKYFKDVHPGFYHTLKKNYADLTQNELRICAFIRLNLDTKQIAGITHKTPKSIENIRISIRKKMRLSLKDNLFDVISTV